MNEAVKVAVVKSDCRRDAVAQALALIEPEIRAVVRPQVLVKPNLVSHRVQRASTHADALSALVDTLLAGGATNITVAEGASDATAGFARFHFAREVWGRPVRFFDINREETAWEPLDLVGLRGEPLVARVSQSVTQAPCRVSLALAKTHVTSIVTLSLKNMLSSIHPEDRIMMHGHAGGGNGYKGWRRLVVELLKQDHMFVSALTRFMGRARNARTLLQGKGRAEGWRRLSRADLGFLRSVEAMNRNLVRLAERTRPHVSIVDGFIAMHREGPRHGTPIRLGTIVAGTDPVAVDAVAAAMMGFDPLEIGYLRYAQEAGLGTADLAAITIVGDPIESVGKRCVPHSNHAVARHWSRLPDIEARWTTSPAPARPAPHGMGRPHARRSERPAKR